VGGVHGGTSLISNCPPTRTTVGPLVKAPLRPWGEAIFNERGTPEPDGKIVVVVVVVVAVIESKVDKIITRNKVYII